MNQDLSDIEFTTVREIIASRMGLFFPVEGWGILKHRLSSAAEELGFEDLSQFVHWLLASGLNKNQINLIAPHLTIPETYFWREPNVFAALTESAIVKLVTLKTGIDKTINIWCAGCSTGEEAYSIAIALCRVIPKIKDWNINIQATDINSKALSKARKGVYGSWSFRNSPLWLKGFYFKRLNGREYEILPEIKEMVTFSSFNLTSGDFNSSVCKNQKMDIVFCRNVLMYLTREWIAKISRDFYDSLSHSGWLVVASCELSTNLFPGFKLVNFPGAILYQKPEEEYSASAKTLQDSGNSQLLNAIPQKVSQSEESGQTSFNTKPDSLSLTKHKYNSKEKLIRTHDAGSASINRKTSLKTKEEIYNENRISIRSLTDSGHLEEALLVCNEAILSDKLAADLYFLRASILQKMDRINEAIKSVRQAIFIDPDYLIGHFTLANLFKQHGNVKKARKHFVNALELLRNIPEDDIPEQTGGISAEHLRNEIIENLQINIAI